MEPKRAPTPPSSPRGAVARLLHLRDFLSRDREGVKELVCQPEAGKEHVEICGEALRWAGSGREVGHYRSGAIEPQRESGRGFVQ